MFTFRLYNPNILNKPYPFVIMYNNQASQELQSMSKTSLENDFLYSKNITFHNHMMTNHISTYMLVIHLYCLSCVFFELYADEYFHSSETGLLV